MWNLVNEMSIALPRKFHISALNLAVASIALSGAIHLAIVPEQFTHSAAHGSFFAFIGVAQLLWALYFRWRPAAPLYWAGVLLSGGLVITWLLAFIVSTPFGAHVEPIDASLVVSKILEIIGLIALIDLIASGAVVSVATTERSSISRLVGSSLVASVIFGAMVWGGGGLADMLLSGSVEGHDPGSDQPNNDSHQFDHEGVEELHLGSVSGNTAGDLQPTPDMQAIANAAVEATLMALEMNNSLIDSSSETPNVSSAAGESNLTVDSTKAPPPVLPSDIEAMIAVAVDTAFSPDIVPTPPPGPPSDIQVSDIQAMVAAAVEAALNPHLALIPTPGPIPDHPGVAMPAAMEANLVDHESEQLQIGGREDSLAEESVPKLSPGELERVTTLSPPLLVGSTAAPATVIQTPRQAESNAQMLPDEEKMDLKIVLFGTVLVALTLVAVVGAVRTWKDIT